MFTRLGRLAVRRRRAVLAVSLLFVALAGVLGTGVFGRLSGGGFDDPRSESTRVRAVLEQEFGTGEPNLVLLVDAATSAPVADGVSAVDDPAVEAAAAEVFAALEERDDVAEVVSYWSLGKVPPLRSTDGTAAMIVARIAGDEDAVDAATVEITDELVGERGPVTVSAAGRGPVFQQVSETIQGDLATAEAIAVPVTMLLLVLVFGGLVAAALPLTVGVVAVLGTFFTLFVVTQFTDVSIFSINLVTALGLGLAIDYSLFIVSRFREELARGRSVDEAVVRTVETAGRTVAVSAVTVAVSLSALLVFPLYFLRSFAYAGIGVTLVSLVASVLTLPAVLAMLGTRVDALRIPGLGRRTAASAGDGFWHRLSLAVMRRPIVVGAAAIGLLVLLGLPFLRVEFGTPDQRVLPADNPARIATDRLRSDFASAEAAAFPVVATRGGAATDEVVAAHAEALAALDGVARVDAPTGRYTDGTLLIGPDPSLAAFRTEDMVRFNVVPDIEPVSEAGEQLVAELRAVRTEGLGPQLVGGASAALVDSKAAIGDRLPLAAGIIAGATFVLLFLMFGSVLVPLKAIVLNLLSLSATFGAMVWIFQDGHLSDFFGFTATGMTDTTTPILMFCIAFGLSMDYEVFLLSRIKEEHDRTGDNTASVALGLERTGRIVTAAAALLAITFVAFSTSGISFIKLFGVGLTLAVLMDATLVRGLLVPAFMRLAGEANWWAPAPMRRIHERFGFSESEPPEVPAPASPSVLESPSPAEGAVALQNREVAGNATPADDASSGEGAGQSSADAPTDSAGRSAPEVVHH